jgi:hypothetical protein
MSETCHQETSFSVTDQKKGRLAAASRKTEGGVRNHRMKTYRAEWRKDWWQHYLLPPIEFIRRAACTRHEACLPSAELA